MGGKELDQEAIYVKYLLSEFLQRRESRGKFSLSVHRYSRINKLKKKDKQTSSWTRVVNIPNRDARARS